MRSIIATGLLVVLLSACGGDKTVVSHYDSGKLKAEWQINSEGKKNGIERQYFASGELMGVVKWVEDLKDSVSTYYWKNGNPRKRVEYELGQPLGTTTWYHQNGQRQKQETYGPEGHRQGPGSEFYASGKPKSTVIYVDNIREGLLRSWYESGNPETEVNFRGGRMDGEYIRYHETGKIQLRGQMRRDEKSGLWQEYDEQGRELFECVFLGNVPNGSLTVYFPASGKVKTVGEVKKGLLNGQVIVFNEAGAKVKIQNWVNGKSSDGTNDLSWLPAGLSVKAEELVAD